MSRRSSRGLGRAKRKQTATGDMHAPRSPSVVRRGFAGRTRSGGIPQTPKATWIFAMRTEAQSDPSDTNRCSRIDDPVNAELMLHQVNLIGTYSNHRNRADLLKCTRRWLREARQAPIQDPKLSVRAEPKESVPRRVADRLGDETVHELVEARRAGAKLRELVERYEVSESSLKRLLRGSMKNP
jgi:hypothetical protein